MTKLRSVAEPEPPMSHDVTDTLRLCGIVQAGKNETRTFIHLIRHRNGMDIMSVGLSQADLIALRDSISPFLIGLQIRENRAGLELEGKKER